MPRWNARLYAAVLTAQYEETPGTKESLTKSVFPGQPSRRGNNEEYLEERSASQRVRGSSP